VDGDSVFRALADPHRRQILDLLFERDGRTLVDLQAGMPMTRFGVMKHLRVLEEAGLVTARKVGREKFHYLNPVPIQLLHDRWIGKYATRHVETLTALKAVLEGDATMTTQAATVPAQVYQVFIKATPQQIWDAITKPEFTSRYFYGTLVDAELKPGGKFVYHAADRSFLMTDGEVIASEPPRRLVATWRALWMPELAAEQPGRVSWEIEPQEGGFCKLVVVHDQLEGAPKTAKEVSGGWMLILSGLKTLLETGESLTTA
jgi:uncharacterized protein YndB with AHSA1/START domain/DNA-binding transcriptional ArsR family regulator